MPDAQAAWRFLEQSDLIAAADEIQAAVRRVAGQITERLGASYPLVLVEKRLGQPKPIGADFVGLEIADRFVFGYGMDAKGYWRNLPEIRAMRES